MKLRDRRGRGRRGPWFGANPAAPIPAQRSRAERFDRLASRAFSQIRRGLPDLDWEVGVDDVPVLPQQWTSPVPLASRVGPTRDKPGMILLYRRPIEVEAAAGPGLQATLWAVLTEQVAQALGTTPERVAAKARRPGK